MDHFGYWNPNNYAIIRAIMQVESASLRQLQRALRGVKTGRIATQEEIARHLGVPQSTISRARTGQLKRETDTTRRILDYANMLLGSAPAPDRLQKALVDYLNAGGDPERMAEFVEAATKVLAPPAAMIQRGVRPAFEVPVGTRQPRTSTLGD